MVPRTRPPAPYFRALLITLIYAAVGTGWILGSDHLAGLIAGEAADLVLFQRIKGLAYVALTAGGLYALIRHALAELRRSEHEKHAGLRARDELAGYLKAIIDAAPVAIFDLDEAADVRSLWNPAAERMFGYPRDKAIGTTINLISDENWHRLESSRRAVQEGAAVELVEIELMRSDGSTFPAAISAAPLPGVAEPTTVVIVSDVTELRRTVEQLESALAEREVLLQEVHHRVKNNLQIVTSLLMMEHDRAGRDAEPSNGRLGLGRAMSRVRSIGRIHEQLYFRQNMAEIELADYVRRLCSDIVSANDPEQRVALELRLHDIRVNLDQAAPFGLILHELLTNAYRHGVNGVRQPAVVVELVRTNDEIELAVSDNGPGGIVRPSTAHPGSGMPLVDALAAQLGGTVEVRTGPGLSVTVRVRR